MDEAVRFFRELGVFVAFWAGSAAVVYVALLFWIWFLPKLLNVWWRRRR